jgi:hypothetical protein
MMDKRKFSEQQVTPVKAWAQAIGVASSPTTPGATLTVPLPDLSQTIKTSGGPIAINYSVRLRADAIGRSIQPSIYVDGVQIPGSLKALDTYGAGGDLMLSDTCIVQVAAGVHKVDVYWYVSAGTATATATGRTLNIREL